MVHGDYFGCKVMRFRSCFGYCFGGKMMLFLATGLEVKWAVLEVIWCYFWLMFWR